MNTWTMAQIERAAILNALRQNSYNVVATARALDMSKTTMYRKLKDYGVSCGRTHNEMCEEARRQIAELLASLVWN